MSIENVNITNFTVFDDITVNFSSGVNVIIGENGTGKTHMLKLMNLIFKPREEDRDYMRFDSYFKVRKGEELMRDAKEDLSGITTKYDSVTFSYWFDFIQKNLRENGRTLGNTDKKYNSVFIPAKEMLTHSKGLPEMAEKYGYSMPFDKSLIDIITTARRWNLATIPQLGKNILPRIEEIIGGKVVVEDDVFYIEKADGTLVNFSVEAEGIKKLALIWQLIMNESITEGTLLFWDEAESNVNPKLFKDIAEILLELSQNGVQVFITSHNYVLAKYIEVLMKDTDKVMFHALYKDEDKSVVCESAETYVGIVNNSIRSENVSLYKAEMEKEFA